MMDFSSICKKALDTYGADSQTRMMFEEMAELQKELCKSARGEDNVNCIAEEIADVYIMLRQMVLLHGCEDVVFDWIDYKLNRLEEKMEVDNG